MQMNFQLCKSCHQMTCNLKHFKVLLFVAKVTEVSIRDLKIKHKEMKK